MNLTNSGFVLKKFPDNKIGGKKKFLLKRHDDINTRKFKITLV